MKTRLLKKLRRIGRSRVNVVSVTETNGQTTGMSLSYDEDKYSDLFEIGDTEETVKQKAEHVFIEYYLDSKRKKTI